MRNTFKAISPVIALLMLIFITVGVSVVIYAWTTGYITSYETQPTGFEEIKVEAYKVDGKLLTIYVRNIGDVSVIVNSIYLISPTGVVYNLSPAVISSSTEIWGGDVWTIDAENLQVAKSSSGLILYDTFTKYNPSVWDDSYVDYNNDWDRVYYDSDGLKLLSESADGWAVRGLITVEKIIDLSYLPVIIEVDLQKTNYKVPGGDAAASPFAACLYLSSNKKRNPYDAKPWFAVKLYPKINPYRTEAQLVTRSSGGTIRWKTLYTWYSASNSQPRGVFLLIFNETNKVYYYFWHDSRSGLPHDSGYWTSAGLSDVFNNRDQYIYLSIDNRVTASSRKVHVRYIQVYRDYKVTVLNVEPEWTVELTDDSWNPLYTSTTMSSSITFNILSYIVKNGMPLEGHIVVRTYNVTEFNTYGGWRISPGETKAITVSISGVPSGEYRVKVVTKNGVEYQYKVMIP